MDFESEEKEIKASKKIVYKGPRDQLEHGCSPFSIHSSLALSHLLLHYATTTREKSAFTLLYYFFSQERENSDIFIYRNNLGEKNVEIFCYVLKVAIQVHIHEKGFRGLVSSEAGWKTEKEKQRAQTFLRAIFSL